MPKRTSDYKYSECVRTGRQYCDRVAFSPKAACSVLGWRSKGKHGCMDAGSTVTGSKIPSSATHGLTAQNTIRVTFAGVRLTQGATHANVPNLASGQNHPKRPNLGHRKKHTICIGVPARESYDEVNGTYVQLHINGVPVHVTLH